MMFPSITVAKWVQHSEGCDLEAYPDEGAYSIGYGHRGVPQGTVWTQEQADASFERDLLSACEAAQNAVKVPLTQGQCDALTDFVYNLGIDRLNGSTLLRLLNMGEYAAARDQFYWESTEDEPDGPVIVPHGWIFSGGKPNKGLIARRKGDQILWDGGDPMASPEV